MGFDKIDLCWNYFKDDIYNQNKIYEQSNRVKMLILREEEEERNVGFLEDPQWGFQVECRGNIPLESFEDN